MKKGLLLVVVMLATIAAKAQEVYVGGSLNVWRNSTGNTTSFKIAPEIGYNFNETWALGAELAYGHEYANKVSMNSFDFAPYIRFSYYESGIVRLFLDGTALIGLDKVKDGDTFSFIAKYGFLGYRRNMDYDEDYAPIKHSFGLNLTSEDLSIGFHYAF